MGSLIHNHRPGLRTSRRPSVLLVGDATSPHVRRLATALDEAEVSLAVASFSGLAGLPGALFDLGDQPAHRSRRYPIAIPRLTRIIRRIQPRIVHAHYLSSFGLLAAVSIRAIRPVRRPVLVQSVWGTDILVTARSPFRRIMATYALRRADAVTGDSAELEVETRRIAGQLRWHRLVFGPPKNLFDRGAHREPLIVSSRRLDPDMRVGQVIQAFAHLRDSHPDFSHFKLVVCGSGSELPALAARWSSRSIQFQGQVAAHQLQDLLLRASAFVSIPMSDGTSASLLEAMAAGAVPIVNNLPANLEWVRPELGEIVTRNPSMSELAAAMARAAARTVDRRLMSAAVAESAWESQIASLIGLYSDLTSENT